MFIFTGHLFSYAALDSILSVLRQEFIQYDATARILDVFPDLEEELRQEEQKMIDAISKAKEEFI
ncbi:MAG: hypothetical protein IKN04_03265 [Clostridia bacterium]|nr:hypothetical protein [Clostridia bacterium]